MSQSVMAVGLGDILNGFLWVSWGAVVGAGFVLVIASVILWRKQRRG